jgi:hypothetical protein
MGEQVPTGQDSAVQPPSPKRPYTRPVLSKYGDVISLTRGTAQTSATDNAGTSV